MPYLQYDAVSDELLFAVAGWLTDKVATITTSLRSAGKVSKDVKSSAAWNGFWVLKTIPAFKKKPCDIMNVFKEKQLKK